MLIYVIRHGQTDWNVTERLQGSRDIPLNALGREQAIANGKALSAILGTTASDFDYVASPLTRTRQTMELVRAQLGLDPSDFRTDDRLIELSFGDWEGLTLDEVALSEPDRVHAREENKWNFRPPGPMAESYEMLSQRVQSWLGSVEKKTVCVCHGGVIRSLFHIIEGVSGHDAAVADTPQDRILKVTDHDLEWLAAPGQRAAG